MNMTDVNHTKNTKNREARCQTDRLAAEAGRKDRYKRWMTLRESRPN